MHQHLWPAALVDVLRRRRRPPRLRDAVLELKEGRFAFDVDAHDPDKRLAELDRDGVDVAVVSLQPTLAASFPPEVIEAYQAGIAEVSERAGGRIRPLAIGPPLDGFAGLCLSAHDLYRLDEHASLLDELERTGRFLFVHPGPPAGAPVGAPDWWGPGIGYAVQMQAAYGIWLVRGVPRWPSLPVVFAILAGGAPFQLERLAGRGLDLRSALEADVYLDTASYGRRALELSLATYGVGRIVYGSDAPVMDPRPMLRELRTFGAAVTTAVCTDNPERLLR
jgi:predicted TIM-barrel fold metal-dependent hydrolase